MARQIVTGKWLYYHHLKNAEILSGFCAINTSSLKLFEQVSLGLIFVVKRLLAFKLWSPITHAYDANAYSFDSSGRTYRLR